MNNLDTKVDIPVYLSEDKDLFLCNLSCSFVGDSMNEDENRDDIILAGTSFFLI